MNVIVGASTDVGRVREANEDSYLVDDPLFVVADGMGGHLAGEVASKTAIDTIADRARAAGEMDPAVLPELVRDANGAIWEKAHADPSLSGMGTTCTLVFVDGQRAHFAHVGDSRAYLFRDHDLRQITEDHTLVARMVRQGRLRPEEADHHPQRSIITRALGVDADVEVDTASLELVEGDRLVLCSDGLTSMIGPQELADVLARESDPQAAADALVTLANDAGGEDNITVLVLDVTRDEGRSSARGAAPQQAPVRSDTDPADRAYTGSPTSRWPRVLLLGLLGVALLAAAGIAAVRYWIVPNSWFVGVADGGDVTIYQGIPDDIAGFRLKDAKERAGIKVDELPEFLQDNVEDGIKVESLGEARAKVVVLVARAEELRAEQARDRRRERRDDGAKTGDGKS